MEIGVVRALRGKTLKKVTGCPTRVRETGANLLKSCVIGYVDMQRFISFKYQKILFLNFFWELDY